MLNESYELRALPLFEEDLNGIVNYIAFTLHNPVAAENLVDAVEKAVYERLKCPEAFEPYRSLKERAYPYYTIDVKNYLIFYVVIGNVMELRRILYSRRNWQTLI